MISRIREHTACTVFGIFESQSCRAQAQSSIPHDLEGTRDDRIHRSLYVLRKSVSLIGAFMRRFGIREVRISMHPGAGEAFDFYVAIQHTEPQREFKVAKHAFASVAP